MPLYDSIPLFLGSLTLMIFGSVLVSRALSRLGPRLQIPEQMMGFITALAADSPEISSTVVAMLSGQKDVGVGVVFGSNLFNLAALLGLTAVIAGRISVRRNGALLDGGVGILITGLATILVLVGTAPPAVLAGLSLAILLLYGYLLALRRNQLQRLPIPEAWKPFIVSAASDAQEHEKEIRRSGSEEESERQAKEQTERAEKRARGEEVKAPRPESTSKLLGLVLGSLVIIVISSFGLVRSTTWLTSGWLPTGLLGTLVLAGLTGIPNVYTATQLAMRHRGSAVMTEAMNSNSLNILVGLMFPSLVFGSLLAHTSGGRLETGWLFCMTAAVVAMLTVSKGLSRGQGLLVIGLYLAFVGLRVWLS